ncbi:MAG: LuxR C-terminal-related transcriptional regulator [Myxococcota bacterium]
MTPGEATVLDMLGRGLSTREIARVRETSPRTVANRVATILKKTAPLRDSKQPRSRRPHAVLCLACAVVGSGDVGRKKRARHPRPSGLGRDR